MLSKVIALFVLVAVVVAIDLDVGKPGGKLIYLDNITAKPHIWKQAQNLTVTANDGLITRVVVIDNRPYKDGEVKIVDGGVGHQAVTIELKSPTLLRGFYFTVKVYAKKNVAWFPIFKDAEAPKHGQVKGNSTQNHGKGERVLY